MKDITLGDAASQVKDASATSLEELQNLAGGADIKVNSLHIYRPKYYMLYLF